MVSLVTDGLTNMSRPTIPVEIKRQVYLEAGHRCAIPTCKAPSPLEIAHIIPWSEVQCHDFSNLICLCANCHSRYDKAQDGFDRKSMFAYKNNLSIVRQQYSDFERILFEMMIQESKTSVTLHDFYQPFLYYSLRDELLEKLQSVSNNVINGVTQGPFVYRLTTKGVTFLNSLRTGNDISQ